MNAMDDALKMGRLVSHADVQAMMQAKSGPFNPSVRVRCPLVDFAPIPASRCQECYYFSGVRNRVIIGNFDEKDPEQAARCFMVECTHPITRGLVYIPHVGV